jgi:AraC-like DNA-binding protein
MKKSEVKAGLQSTIGSLLTSGKDGKVETKSDFGNFTCSVETYDNFTIVQRDFETNGESLNIPFSCYEPSVQMIFSFDGRSFFNKQSHPLMLGPLSHCINYFYGYDCTNLLAEKSQQHDIGFLLTKTFYADLIAQHLSSSDDHLPSMIAKEREFNTINQHIPADAGVLGILRNILDCPFQGKMKKAFLREHIRALLTLQLFHFDSVVGGTPARIDTKIMQRDKEILQAVKEYIDANYLDPNSIENLSKHFGLNEFKLKHGFKFLFDTSPMRYLQQKRLTFGLSLLRDTNKSIKEISDEIGYSHAANFTTAFVKTFGKPPQHYRRSRAVELFENSTDATVLNSRIKYAASK